MTANPTTDQYRAKAKADNLSHERCPPVPGGCLFERRENAWRDQLLATLPDVDPAIVGQVLLHIGTLLPQLTDHFVFALVPGKTGPYLRDSLRYLGANLLDTNSDNTPETPADGV